MESAEAEKTQPDVLVQVPVAVEGGFGIVEVQRAEVFHADDGIEIVEGAFKSVRGAEVVARRERVACVDANADAGFVVNLGDYVTEVLKGAADDVAATGHVLEDGFDGFGGCVGVVERRGYAADGGGAGGWAGVSRVEVVEFDAEGFAAVQVVDEGVVGLSCLGGVFLGEVDEV